MQKSNVTKRKRIIQRFIYNPKHGDFFTCVYVHDIKHFFDA